MERRKILTGLLIALSFIGLVSISIPLLGSLSPRARVNIEVDLPVLIPGQPVILSIDGVPLIILRPKIEQLSGIKVLDDHVATKKVNTFRPEIGAYVYWGLSTRRDVCAALEVKPAQRSQLADWDSNARWLGGYWDPICEVSYDYAGRAITNYKYSFNGFVGQYHPLRTPLVVKKIGNKLRISRYAKEFFLPDSDG